MSDTPTFYGEPPTPTPIARGGSSRAALPLAIVLLGIPPAVRLKRWKENHRRGSGNLCKSCGYDLRATPHRCPECGAGA